MLSNNWSEYCNDIDMDCNKIIETYASKYPYSDNAIHENLKYILQFYNEGIKKSLCDYINICERDSSIDYITRIEVERKKGYSEVEVFYKLKNSN